MALIDEATVLEWLNSNAGSRVRSIREAQSGAALCRLVCNLTDSPEMISRIQRGTTLEERPANFRLIQELIEVLKLGFDYDVDALANGNRMEFLALVRDLMSLEEDNEPHGDNTDDTDGFGDELETLLSDLETNLAGKLQDLAEFQAELKDLALERDFYFSKLLRMEKICKKYAADDVRHVVAILTLSNAEFEPVNSSTE
jgi:hypothetical protein